MSRIGTVLVGEDAPTDVERLRGDVARVVRGEEGDEVGNVLRLLDPAERDTGHGTRFDSAGGQTLQAGCLVRATTACLLAAYAPSGTPRPGAIFPAPEALLMIRPPSPCSIIRRAAACEQSRTPFALTAINASHVSSFVSSSGATTP